MTLKCSRDNDSSTFCYRWWDKAPVYVTEKQIYIILWYFVTDILKVTGKKQKTDIARFETNK